MAEVGSGRTAGSRRGRGGRQRRPPTWELSDSDAEGTAAPVVGARAPSAAGKSRAVSEPRRSDQVLKRLAVCVDPALLEDAGSDILMEALGALGCECRIEPQRPARSLRWSGGRPDPGPSCATPEMLSEDEQLLLLEPQEFLQGAAQLTQALVLLQLYADVDVLLVESWQELSQHVCAFTKALSQRPSKQHRDSQAFPFCTAGRWASGLRVTRDGSGLRGVWWRQIRQFNRVSPAVADSIITAFPSPRLLQQALMACSTEQERLGLLADLPVKALEDGQSRRVGPDLSRRICLFLTTTNPDLLLDLTS